LHEPQFWVSVCRTVQLLLQYVWPGMHIETHVAAWH
jgi:hypothetical protein